MSTSRGPSGEVVDEWGSRRIIEWRMDGHTIASIAALARCSERLVKNILKLHRAGQSSRVPKQGQGRTDDVRWIFGGSRGEGNLRALERLRDAYDDTSWFETCGELLSSCLGGHQHTPPLPVRGISCWDTPRSWYVPCPVICILRSPDLPT